MFHKNKNNFDMIPRLRLSLLNKKFYMIIEFFNCVLLFRNFFNSLLQ